MPCPHFDVSIVCRSKGQSAVASAAYQSGSKLYDEYSLSWKNYTHKDEIIFEQILLPEKAPPEYSDRQTLWSSVEVNERNWNAQLARKIRMALPKEVPLEQYQDMVKEYCMEQFVSKGMICDIAIHDKGDGNPHAHLLLTMRSLDENGKWNPKSKKVYILDENGEKIRLPSGNYKTRKENFTDWDNRDNCEIWRQAWSDIQNKYLEANGRDERVDLRSYERQGIDKIPMIHEGPAVSAMERKGVKTNIGNLNRDIRATNNLLAKIRKTINKLKAWIEELSEKRREILEILREEKEPTLPQLLYDYLHAREEERKTWSKKAQLKGLANDFNKINEVIKYLEKRKINTVDDLKTRIEELSGTVSESRKVIKANDRRIATIDGVMSAYKTYKELKPVFDEYQKKGFKISKDMFYNKHKDEIDSFNKALRYLKKNVDGKSGSKITVPIESLREEKVKLSKENEVLGVDVLGASDELKTLNTVRFYISKVVLEPEDVRKFMDEKVGKMSVKMALREDIAKVAREDITKERNHIKSRGKEESL